MVLIDFANQVQFNRQRRKLRQPINEQEKFVLQEQRSAYVELLAGSAAIKAHLASVVALARSRDAVLARLEALQAQRKMVHLAVSASDAAVEQLKASGELDEGITAFLEAMEAARTRLQSLGGSGEIDALQLQ